MGQLPKPRLPHKTNKEDPDPDKRRYFPATVAVCSFRISRGSRSDLLLFVFVVPVAFPPASSPKSIFSRRSRGDAAQIPTVADE